MKVLTTKFFSREADLVAQDLLGKVIRVKHRNHFLSAMIIETEAYFIHEKGSHSSLGFTEKRKALFMPAGTIYMYYARGADSLNVSCLGEGNAVLIKSAYPYCDESSAKNMLEVMQKNNPAKNGSVRPIEKLCSGQTLLCKSLGLKVKEWDQKQFIENQFFIEDVGYKPEQIIQTKRLGIPVGRDEHLLYRFIDSKHMRFCTKAEIGKAQKEQRRVK
jgi:DNA-3-methyladenine glycosylase